MGLQVGQAYIKLNKDSGTLNYDFSNRDTLGGSDSIFSKLQSEKIIGGTTGYAIYYFGIQSLPGLTFNINSNKTNATSTIQIGQTGIFELDLFDSSPIGEIKFENLEQKLKEGYEITTVENNGQLEITVTENSPGVNYCLIDVIYEKTT